MDGRFKNRFSRIFRSSLSSCRNRNFSDVAEKAVFSLQNQSDLSSRMSEYPLLSSQKARPFPSICKPRCPELMSAIDHNCIMMASHPRRKLSARKSPFVFLDDFGGRTCPPASPASPLFPISESKNFDFYEKTKKKKKDKKENKQSKKNQKTKRRVHNAATFFSSSSQDSVTYRRSWWSSSDEDGERQDETDTLFSSQSLSSDSSGFRRPRSFHRRRAVNPKIGVLPIENGATKMKDSFAVVKSSSDPYNDFRTSMVEMIVEKQIFSAQGLEQLLQCFLSLNSNHHHRIILEVFTEIYEALFSNWP